MNDRDVRASKSLQNMTQTANRLARRMGAEFVFDERPQVENCNGKAAEPVPARR